MTSAMAACRTGAGQFESYCHAVWVSILMYTKLGHEPLGEQAIDLAMRASLPTSTGGWGLLSYEQFKVPSLALKDEYRFAVSVQLLKMQTPHSSSAMMLFYNAVSIPDEYDYPITALRNCWVATTAHGWKVSDVLMYKLRTILTDGSAAN
jgi:hypothetical protein